MKEKAPTTNQNLLQVRLSENEKRNIKMMAAGQGLTLREATLAAFTAWLVAVDYQDVVPGGSARLIGGA